MDKTSTFAARLRELLDTRGITQAQLAKTTHISKASISRYLKGDWEAKQDNIYAIARATNVSEAWLMGYDVAMERFTPSTAAGDAHSDKLSDLEQKVIAIMRQLNPDGQARLVEQAEFFASKDEYKNFYSTGTSGDAV